MTKASALDKKRKQVARHAEAYDLTRDRIRPELAALSNLTQIEGVYVDPEGVVFTGARFEGVMSVFLSLEYAAEREFSDAFTTSDSLLAHFRGHFAKNGKPRIDEIAIDTSRFYK